MTRSSTDYLVDTGNLRNQPIACLEGFQSINVFPETMPQWVAEYFPVHPGEPTSQEIPKMTSRAGCGPASRYSLLLPA